MLTMDLRIGQLNLARARAMSGELEVVAEDHKLDVVLVQEPYCTSRGSVLRPQHGRIVAHAGGGGRRWCT